MEHSDFVTVKEAARRLSVCRTSVYRLAWSGKLKLYRLGARSTRVRADDVEKLLTNAEPVRLAGQPALRRSRAEAA